MTANATGARATMPGMRLDPSYRRELVRRVEALAARGVTMRALAREAKLNRQSLWRLLRDADQNATAEQAEKVRHAVMRLDPDGPPIPPPVTITLTRGPGHPTWRTALRADRRR